MPHRGLAAPELILDIMLTGKYGSHSQLTVRKPWATYMGTDTKHIVRRVKLTDTLS
jgi:hypothetical protein